MIYTPLDYICPHCGADFCNEFALLNHIAKCQEHVGKQEPEDV